MARAAEIIVTAYFDRDEPDGSECAACGDRCYLWMWRLMMRCGKRRIPTCNVLCEGCHQATLES